MNETSEPWVQGLMNPECFPHSVDQMRLVETHISWVLLTGPYAYKIKKAVKYSFVDFSTLERRRWFCEEEVRLNGRLAPELYLGIVPITGSPGIPYIDGQGTPFEYAVKMKQFSVEQEMQQILLHDEKADEYFPLLAEKMAIFHAEVEKAETHSLYGHPDRVWQPVKECFDEMPLHVLTPTTQKHLATIHGWLQKEWQKLSEIFLHRKHAGFVRECHGDLHLGNIAMFEGKFCVFDALEFEPRLRWIDVMSEVAFLVIDLEKYGRKDLAFVFLNRYLELTGDYDALKVFRFYKVYRALVRAKVAGLRLAQLAGRGIEEETLNGELTEYVKLGHSGMAEVSPILILMHGVSGTGKTTMSTEIIKSLGAVRVRSDVERKRLFAGELKRQPTVPQETGLYHSDITTCTYEQLRHVAGTVIQAGFPVIVDATFLQRGQREVFRLFAKELACPFIILDAQAPKAIVAERIRWRSQEGKDASDATLEVMERQQKTQERFSPEERSHVLEVDSTDPQSINSAIRNLHSFINC